MSKLIAAALVVSAMVVGGSVVSDFSETDHVKKVLMVEVHDSESSKRIPLFKKTVSAPTKLEPRCHTSYSGCLKPNYTGPVEVVGPDVFDLDRDSDGWGCEG